MRRALLLSFLLATFAFADWCIVHATQKAIHDDEDKIFFQRFAKGVIVKKRGMYRFESGPYATKKEALQKLKKARRYNRDAFLRRCTILVGERSVAKVTTPKKKAISSKKEIKPPRSSEDEGVDLEALVAGMQKPTPKEYEEIGFYEYLDKLLKRDFTARGLGYRQKLAYMEALIENSVYDWDLFANVAVSYSKFIDYDFVTNKELTFDAGINLNKRLFDAGVLVKDRLVRLKRHLAKLQSLDAKDKLSLYGLDIYAQTLLNQRTKDLYEEIYYNQKAFYKLIKERAKAGLASRVDEIDAKNDLLGIKKALLLKIYNYLYSDFLLRTSAEINTTKPLRLKDFGIDVETLSTPELFQRAFEKNVAIRKERSLLALKKAYLKKQESSYLPVVDFTSSIFYEYKKDYAQEPTASANGLNYQALLNFKFPIYSTQNRGYLLQKAKLDALLQRYALLDTIKKTSQEVQRYTSELRRLKSQLHIVQEQLALMKEKQELVKKRYISGLSSYRQYSDAVRSFLSLIEEKMGLEIAILQDSAMLKILEGHKIFYGED